MLEGLLGSDQRLSENFINKDGKAYAQHVFKGHVRKGPGRRLGDADGGGMPLDGEALGGGLQEGTGTRSQKRGQSLKFRKPEEGGDL